ncbi:hypothetical protein CRM22_004826 [Opisthorchis felineus]|nr:hypothetical protein CRM22_004826 [Opisthorchis felineus]
MWSVWTVVILTTERFLLILFPLRFQKFLSPKVAWITIGCSTFLIGLISLPWLFSFSYVVQKDCSASSNAIKTSAQTPSVYELCTPNNVYRVLRLMQIPLIVLLPGIILTFENTKIAFTLAKRRGQWMSSSFAVHGSSNSVKNCNQQSGSDNRIDSVNVNNPMAECHRQAKEQENRLTLQLLIVSCTFWILSMPSLIFVGLRALAENANSAHHVSETFANGYYVSWFLYQLNMCIDFFIYCVVGSTFRETLWALLERDWSRFHRLRNTLCKGRLIDSRECVTATTSDSRRLN